MVEEQKDQGNQFISMDEVGTMIRNKEHLYKAIVANGYLLPKMKSQICTVEFLKEVRAKIVYCPLLATIQMQTCAFPPSNQAL